MISPLNLCSLVKYQLVVVMWVDFWAFHSVSSVCVCSSTSILLIAVAVQQVSSWSFQFFSCVLHFQYSVGSSGPSRIYVLICEITCQCFYLCGIDYIVIVVGSRHLRPSVLMRGISSRCLDLRFLSSECCIQILYIFAQVRHQISCLLGANIHHILFGFKIHLSTVNVQEGDHLLHQSFMRLSCCAYFHDFTL